MVAVAGDGNLGAAAGGLALDGGTLRSTASFASGRAVTLGAGRRQLRARGRNRAGAVGRHRRCRRADQGRAGNADPDRRRRLCRRDGDRLRAAAARRRRHVGVDQRRPGRMTGRWSSTARTRRPSPGAISGTGTVEQVGTGTTVLSGAGSYSGATTVAAGTLAGGATGAFSPASGFAVAAGATLDLGDFGQRLGGLANAGLVSLGAAPGTRLTVRRVYDGAGGVLRFSTRARRRRFADRPDAGAGPAPPGTVWSR